MKVKRNASGKKRQVTLKVVSVSEGRISTGLHLHQSMETWMVSPGSTSSSVALRRPSSHTNL